MDGHQVAYPKILCNSDVIAGDDEDGENIDTKYLARNLQSLIGDSIYDVIILDFFEDTNCYDGRLQYRLRRRFPNAALISLQAYLIGWTSYWDSSISLYRTVGSWASKNGFKSLSDQALSAFCDSSEEWTMYPFDEQNRIWRTLNKQPHTGWITKENYTNYDNMTSNQIKDLLIRRSYLFNDWTLFNDIGHEDVAKGILDLTKYMNASRNDTVTAWDGNQDDNYTCYDCFNMDEAECKANEHCEWNTTITPDDQIQCDEVANESPTPSLPSLPGFKNVFS